MCMQNRERKITCIYSHQFTPRETVKRNQCVYRSCFVCNTLDWRQLKCLSSVEWRKQLEYIHKMRHYRKIPKRMNCYMQQHGGQMLLLSRSVVSASLRPRGRQRARLPCPPPSPGVCSGSGPLSRWCYLTIASSPQIWVLHKRSQAQRKYCTISFILCSRTCKTNQW